MLEIEKNYPFDLVITSVNDSTHSPNSKHYIDQAIDIRSHYFNSAQEKEDFRFKYESFLNTHGKFPGRFRVLLESVGTSNEHFHAQVKRGRKFP